jgi:Putative peptidoglycan binding domain
MSPQAASTTARPDLGKGHGTPRSDRTDVASATPDTTRRLSRRRALAAGGVVTVALIAGGGLLAINGQAGQDDNAEDADATEPLPTVAVERRTLEEHADLDGTLGYGDITDVTLSSEGKITALPTLGTVVDRGQTLVEVDSQPVPLLIGERPMWRELAPGVGDGVDIQQLEANLVALGVEGADELTVDQDWTDFTTQVVKDWQESRGLSRTGVMGPNDIVFLPGPVRVTEHPAPVGSPASASVLGVTNTTPVVTVDLEASRRSLVEPGKPVVVVLPGGTEVAATVSTVGAVATGTSTESDDGSADDDGPQATVEVIVTIDDPAALAAAAFDQAPVTVRVVSSAAEGVLAVPVQALLALSEGGYAVEVAHDDGTTSLVAVEVGPFADGWVEITGDVAEGDRAEVPE